MDLSLGLGRFALSFLDHLNAVEFHRNLDSIGSTLVGREITWILFEFSKLELGKIAELRIWLPNY